MFLHDKKGLCKKDKNKWHCDKKFVHLEKFGSFRFYQACMGQTQLVQVASNYGEYLIPWRNQGFKVQI